MVKEAEEESDRLSLASFEQLSARYVSAINERMADAMLGGMMNLQSIPALTGSNSLNL